MVGLTARILFVVLLLEIHYTTTQADCDTGWFGPNCQFKCRCSDGCDANGQCKGQKCLVPWFGYKCQYLYLEIVTGITISSDSPDIDRRPWVDSDDYTCIFDASITRVVITTSRIPFFFIRLAVGDAALVNKFTVTYEDYSDVVVKRVPCRRQAFTAVNNRSVDIRCENAGVANRVILEGDGVTSLCSIYISRGRNLALRQLAEQTSTDDAYYAKNAVDGNYDGNCSLTNNATNVPQSWTLTFDEPVVPASFQFFSRGPAIYIDNSKLQSFDINGTIINSVLLYGTYFFTFNINTVPIQKVKITATNSSYPTVFLTICELVIYGACQPGKWGLDCKQQCDSKCPDFCSEWDGLCPTACLGYQAPGCTAECPMDKWGVNCREDCSDRCQYKYCNNVDGLCTAGCSGYSDTPYCTKVCLKGSYGTNCGNKCSANCVNGECDYRNGTCLNGCTDQHGTFCAYPNIESSSFSGASFGIGFGVCVGAVLLIVVIVIVIVRYMRKQKREESGKSKNGGTETTRAVTTTVQTVTAPESYDVTYQDHNNFDDYQLPEDNNLR